MPTTTTLLHLTMNTGHLVRASGLTPPEELAAVQPLLDRGGPIPTRDPYWVELDREAGWATFCLYHGTVPLTLNLLVWENAVAREAWTQLELLYFLDLSSGAMPASACPAQPTATPWLATLLSPKLALPDRPVNELLWIAAFERIYAEALLANAA